METKEKVWKWVNQVQQYSWNNYKTKSFTLFSPWKREYRLKTVTPSNLHHAGQCSSHYFQLRQQEHAGWLEMLQDCPTWLFLLQPFSQGADKTIENKGKENFITRQRDNKDMDQGPYCKLFAKFQLNFYNWRNVGNCHFSREETRKRSKTEEKWQNGYSRARALLCYPSQNGLPFSSLCLLKFQF